MCEEVNNEAVCSVQNQITFIEETHQYYVNGKQLPSVSEIMSVMSKEYYADINPTVLANAAKRGTKVHEAIEVYEKFGLETEDIEIYPYLRSYKVAKQLEKFEVFENELRLHNGEFAGTLDMLAILNGTVIVDLKATSKINTELLEVQLAGYQELAIANGYDIRQVYVLHLKKDGYKFKIITPNDIMWQEMKREYAKLSKV